MQYETTFAPPRAKTAGTAFGMLQAQPRDLLPGLRAHNDSSYEELVRRYGGKMQSVATRIMGNPEDARDCVQDAFLQAFKNIDRFEGRSSIWTWLHRIVANSALLQLRSRRRRPEGSIDPSMAELDDYQRRIEPRGGVRESTETLLSKKETRVAVREAIDTLQKDYRTVLLLRDIVELDTQEVARILKIRPGAVKTRLHRARAALRKVAKPLALTLN